VHEANGRASALETQLQTLNIELQSGTVQLAALKSVLQEKKDEASTLRTEMNDMVHRKELAVARGQLQTVQMQHICMQYTRTRMQIKCANGQTNRR